MEAQCLDRASGCRNKKCHLLPEALCRCGPKAKSCCARPLDGQLASPSEKAELKTIMTSNRAAAARDIHIYHLLEFDAYGYYGIKDENARTADDEKMGWALADVATRVTAIFDDCLESLKLAADNSITKKFYNRVTRTGAPEGRSWRSLLNEAEIGEVLGEEQINDLISVIKSHMTTAWPNIEY